jgi:DNA-binding response OmpR family regulator
MRQRILIVEDEPTLLFAIQDYLDQQGYEVSCAAELEEASALLMNIPYDVVITDLRLTPVQAAEGLHVIELVRQRSLPARVIVLTGSATAAVEKSARLLGVDRYLRKPVALSVIAQTVSELVAQS